MTLNEALQQKLDRWRFTDGRQALEAETGDVKVHVAADCSDLVGCKVWEVNLTRPAPADSLKVRAERLASRASGLLEPLRLVEVDEPRQVAMLRSDKPAVRADQLGYYEVLLHGDGAASVRRYQTSRQGATRREQTGYTLTHDALAKLAGDLADC